MEDEATMKPADNNVSTSTNTVKRRLNRSNSDPTIYPLKRMAVKSGISPDNARNATSANVYHDGNMLTDDIMSFSMDGSNKEITRNFSFGSANVVMMSKSNSSPNLTSLVNESNNQAGKSDQKKKEIGFAAGKPPTSGVKPTRAAGKQLLFNSLTGGAPMLVPLNSATLDCESHDLFASVSCSVVMHSLAPLTHHSLIAERQGHSGGAAAPAREQCHEPLGALPAGR